MNSKLIIKHSLFQVSNTLRNPEQILLLTGTPLAVMFFFADSKEIFSFTLATCVLSIAFTSNAITTAFGRRYGSLKYFSVTPLGLNGVVFGQAIAGILLVCIQLPFAVISAKILSVQTNINWTILLALLLQTVLFTQWAYIFASAFSAEKVLALANVIFLGLLISGVYMLGQNLNYLHPLAGITNTGIEFSFFLGILVFFNLISFVTLKKVFKWVE